MKTKVTDQNFKSNHYRPIIAFLKIKARNFLAVKFFATALRIWNKKLVVLKKLLKNCLKLAAITIRFLFMSNDFY